MRTMTYLTSAQKLNSAKLRQTAEWHAVVTPIGCDFGMPETPALREVDL